MPGAPEARPGSTASNLPGRNNGHPGVKNRASVHTGSHSVALGLQLSSRVNNQLRSYATYKIYCSLPGARAPAACVQGKAHTRPRLQLVRQANKECYIGCDMVTKVLHANQHYEIDTSLTTSNPQLLRLPPSRQVVDNDPEPAN